MINTKTLVKRLLAKVISKPGVDIHLRSAIKNFLYKYEKELNGADCDSCCPQCPAPNETGATVFDFSAANIAGKYPGKDGLKMLMHLLSKVGKALQPTIILINDCEKQFVKKLSKADKEVKLNIF